MQHSLRNLLDSAIKFTAQHGSVSVALFADEATRRCIIDITDSGSGIPEEELKSIFRPFYRSYSHKSTIPGSGLGLSIAKKIIENHGGSVSVQSFVQKGTTFTISIPFLRVDLLSDSAVPRERIVIIGGVAAGPKAAARLRGLNEEIDITIIEKSEFLS